MSLKMLEESKDYISQNQKELFESIFLNSYDAILVTDKEGKVIIANPASLEILEISFEEMIGTKLQELINRKIYNKSVALEAMEKRQVVTGVVKTISDLVMISTSTPIIDDNDELEMVITTSKVINGSGEIWKRIQDKREEIWPGLFVEEKSFTNEANIYASEKMKEMLIKVERAAKIDSAVIINGETGTGKSVLAELIHKNSGRKDKPFVEINCAVIPEALIESEFFGYEKGAFTGADVKGKIGLLEVADGGTIFLDEIGEMPVNLQSKLLKFLDTGLIRRVGGTVYHKLDVRVIAATNRNLLKMINDGRFREDLYYRLNVICFTVPPLRERKSDIEKMAHFFVKSFENKYNKYVNLTESAKTYLIEYDWPGNIRQLKNIAERIVIMSEDADIDGDIIKSYMLEDRGHTCLESDLKNSENDNFTTNSYTGTLKEAMDKFRKDYIDKTLKESGGNVTQAAKKLGIHRTAIYK